LNFVLFLSFVVLLRSKGRKSLNFRVAFGSSLL